MKIIKFIQQFARDEEGVTAIEYGLLAALIGVSITVAVTALGTQLGTLFTSIKTAITPAG